MIQLIEFIEKFNIYENFGSGKNTQTGWVKRTPPLSDAHRTITDLKFAPKFLGLQLAICSQNGEVRSTYRTKSIFVTHPDL